MSITDSLLVRHMRVIWRDTFIIEKPVPDFLVAGRACLAKLPIVVADRFTERHLQPEVLQVTERVARQVASTGYEDLVRLQLSPMLLADLGPTLDRLRRAPRTLTYDQIYEAMLEADERDAWVTITPLLVLHRAGVGCMAYHATFYAPEPGYSVERAIRCVRMGISPQLLRLSAAWREVVPDEPSAWGIDQVLDLDVHLHLVVSELRNLTGIIAARLRQPSQPRRKRRKAPQAEQRKHLRPTGSASVILVDVEPRPGPDFDAYVASHAVALHGIGAMDTLYQARSEWLVRRDLQKNLSTDSEMAIYLLGSSELVLFNQQLDEVLPRTQRRLRLSSPEHAVTYVYMHYIILMEWIYLQEAILRIYLQRLDELAATPNPRRRKMIATLHGALHDLIQYQDRITPFATRIEFLERARRHHKLDELAEQFDRKQEMLLDYASEFHDYREARASEFLNWLASILTGAALANLIVTLAGITPEQPTLYLGITVGSIVLVLAILASLQYLRAG